MHRLKTITVTALSTVLVVALGVLVGSQVSSLRSGAGATTVVPTWQTSAGYTPLTNVSAVSCAPNSSPSSATCVAVGDDGGHVASAIVSQNGGATWSESTLPSGVTTLSAVSCPSSAICYAGGSSGIFKSSNGGASWTVQDSSFPAQSISCFTIDECTAVGGSEIAGTSNGLSWLPQVAPSGLNSLGSVSCATSSTCVAVGVGNSAASIVGTQDGDHWTTLDQPFVSSLTSISCSKPTTCVTVGVAEGGGGTQSLAQARPPVSPSARTSAPLPTSWAPPTTARHGPHRAHRATPSM